MACIIFSTPKTALLVSNRCRVMTLVQPSTAHLFVGVRNRDTYIPTSQDLIFRCLIQNTFNTSVMLVKKKQKNNVLHTYNEEDINHTQDFLAPDTLFLFFVGFKLLTSLLTQFLTVVITTIAKNSRTLSGIRTESEERIQ